MRPYFKIHFVVFLSISFFGSCAKEQSKEERDREERDRKLQRLEQSEGEFHGTIDSNSGKTPIQFSITTNKRSTSIDEDPQLVVVMTVGFFGGVKSEANTASFDSGTGEILASFGSALDSRLELRGSLAEGKLTGSLIGTHQGEYFIDSAKDSLSLLETEEKFEYLVKFDGETEASAELIIEKLNKKTNSPDTYDLPEFPGLSATFRFLKLGASPIVVNDFNYDPLSGYIEIKLTSKSVIKIRDVFLNESNELPELSKLEGDLELSQKVYGKLIIEKSEQKLTAKDLTKKPLYYHGTYRGLNSTVSFDAIGKLTATEKTGNNLIDYPFASFPMLNVNLTICLGDTAFKQFSYRAIGIDHIKRILKFDRILGKSGVVDFEYSAEFDQFHGRIVESNDTDELNASIQLNSINSEINCTYFDTDENP